MSAIVAEPVDWFDAATVLDSMRSSSGVERFYVPARRSARGRRSGGGHLRGGSWGRGLLAQVGEEQGLVDSALEDGHAQLHALLDDVSSLHSGFARELGGREVDCHRYEPPVRFATWTQGTGSPGRPQPHLLNPS